MWTLGARQHGLRRISSAIFPSAFGGFWNVFWVYMASTMRISVAYSGSVSVSSSSLWRSLVLSVLRRLPCKCVRAGGTGLRGCLKTIFRSIFTSVLKWSSLPKRLLVPWTSRTFIFFVFSLLVTADKAKKKKFYALASQVNIYQEFPGAIHILSPSIPEDPPSHPRLL